MCFPTRKAIVFFALIFHFSFSSGQTFGIGVDVPGATLDVRSTTAMITLNIDRTLSGSAGGKSTVKISDASDFSVLEINQSQATNSEDIVNISNAGVGTTFRASSTNSSSAAPTALITNAGNSNGSGLEVANSGITNAQEAIYASHAGIGLGLLVEMTKTTNASDGIQVTHEGAGDGLYVTMNNATGTQQGVDVTHYGVGHGIRVDMANSPGVGSNYGMLVNTYQDNQIGVYLDNETFSAWGLLNKMEDGVAIYNDFGSDNGVSVFSDLYNVDGSGYFFTNVDIPSLPTVTGTGDGFALDVFMNTSTASVGSTSYGAVVGGDQYGRGHGLIINHSGTSGRNAELNISNSSNPDPAIFSVSSGTGSVIVGQQQNNTIGAQVKVADFSYIGTEVRDHIAVYGSSIPIAGSGIGGFFQGGKYGVYGNGGSISAVHAVGNMSATGTKPFMIDHPLDPENKILRHFSIESNEVLNMYRGVVLIGRGGKASVTLPEYFEAINTNFTYQLTSIGSSHQAWIANEIAGNRFTIAGKPGTKVSWTVHANRNDAYVQTHPDQVATVMIKTPEEKGKYLDPESHRKPASKAIFYLPATEQTPMQRKLPKAAMEAAVKNGQFKQPKHLDAGHARMKYQDRVQPADPNPTDNGAGQFQPMEIKQEIKTWDELH